jgi:hypothetical protein
VEVAPINDMHGDDKQGSVAERYQRGSDHSDSHAVCAPIPKTAIHPAFSWNAGLDVVAMKRRQLLLLTIGLRCFAVRVVIGAGCKGAVED